MSKIEEKINKASDTYGRTCLNRCRLKDRQMPQFDAYDIETAFEQGAKWMLSLPLSERLTDDERNKIRALWKEAKKGLFKY